MKELIIALLMQASNLTGLAAPTEPSIELRYLEPCQMISEALGPAAKCDLKRMHIVAYYEDDINRMNLPSAFKRGELSVLDRSILLHELVHYLQDEHGIIEKARETDCIGRVEGQAYQAQFKWLKANGVADPLEALDLNAMTLLFLTQCGRPY